MSRIVLPPPPARAPGRRFRAVAIVQQDSTAHYLRLAGERVREREDRLRSFNRTVLHESTNAPRRRHADSSAGIRNAA
jgi:hypothetical protein